MGERVTTGRSINEKVDCETRRRRDLLILGVEVKIRGKILKVLLEIACDDHITGHIFGQCGKQEIFERKEKCCNQNLLSMPY